MATEMRAELNIDELQVWVDDPDGKRVWDTATRAMAAKRKLVVETRDAFGRKVLLPVLVTGTRLMLGQDGDPPADDPLGVIGFRMQTRLILTDRVAPEDGGAE